MRGRQAELTGFPGLSSKERTAQFLDRSLEDIARGIQLRNAVIVEQASVDNSLEEVQELGRTLPSDGE